MRTLSNLLLLPFVLSLTYCVDDNGEYKPTTADVGNDSTNNGTTNSENNGSTARSTNNTPERFCIKVSPNSIAFGKVKIGASGSADLTVINCGSQLQDISVTPRPPFKTPLVEASLEPEGRVVFPVQFEPTDPQAESTVVTISAGGSRFDVQVTGTGESP